VWIAATEAGSSSAAGNLAHFCEEHGDLAEAENWWRRAAELGLPDATAPRSQLGGL